MQPGNDQNRREAAEVLALQAVAWILGDDDRRQAFLTETGMDPGGLAGVLRQPAFLAAVLDHVLTEDARVLALVADLGLRPEDILAARAHLPGGDLPHWT